jgi:hypothetical protein
MIVPFSSIERLSIHEACSAIVSAPKKRLRDAKLFDFIIQGGKELTDGVHGIYFFFAPDNTTCLYVGKSSSMQFIERIPWHFAIGEASWQNHFLKYYKKDRQCSSLFEAAKETEDCQILLMPVEDALITEKSEKFFRIFQKPQFNTLQSRRYRLLASSISINAKLGEVVRDTF